MLSSSLVKCFDFLYICEPQGFNLEVFNLKIQFDLKQNLILFFLLLLTPYTLKFNLLHIILLSAFPLL